MSSKKGKLLNLAAANMLKEFQPHVPEAEHEEVENDLHRRIRKVLGNNWATLPITGPRMMVLVLIMNYVLLPYGITPSRIADKAIEKGREYEVDQRFSELMVNAKGTAESTGQFTSETIKELTRYSEEKGKKIGGTLREVLGPTIDTARDALDVGIEKGKDLLNSGIEKGKDLFKRPENEVEKNKEES